MLLTTRQLETSRVQGTARQVCIAPPWDLTESRKPAILIGLDLLDRFMGKMTNDSITHTSQERSEDPPEGATSKPLEGYTSTSTPVPMLPHGMETQGHQRGWIARAARLGAVLLLIVAAAAAYRLAQRRPDTAGTTGQPTPAQSATITAGTLVPTPEMQAKTPSPEPLAPEELEALLARAEELTWQSQFEQATSIYQELTLQAPNDARPEIGWAWVLILDGQFDQALKHARHAMELDPVRVEAVTSLARAYVKTGDRDRALAMAQSAVQLNPSSAQAHAVLAQAYQLDGQLPQAVDEANQALALDPASAEAHQARGWLYLAVDGDAARGADELQIAANLQPELWLRQHELGLLLIKAGQYDRAIVALKTALGLRPKAETYTALGEAYYRLGEYSRAESYLGQALVAGAEGADTFALLAALNARQDRCDDAQTYLEQALALDPTQPLALEARDACGGTQPARTPVPTRSARTPTPGQPPPASPAPGGRIAFPVWNSERNKHDTYVASVDGHDRHLVAEEMDQPAFDSSGRWLAVNGNRNDHMNLCLVQPDGTGLHEITEYIEDGLPAWSPDGKSLAFSSTREQDRQSRIYVIDQVFAGSGRAQDRPLYAGIYELLGEYPAWTDDGRIVYAGCDYEAQPVQCGLFLIPAAPGPQTPEPLTNDPSDTAPAAYGTGPTRIAFMSNRDGNWEIYLVNADGSGLKRLTNSPANDGLPTWSPAPLRGGTGGAAIAFVSDQGGEWAVWAIDPDGTHRRKLFDIGGQGLGADWQHQRISWGP
jgi:tetratricopeptide (TPR) repeat protein